ncbi:MAG: hypothetical protein Ct9H90mP24_6170 [Methanobacteriota archaeon]|nr:MAG: hypothetical protein Ct9H90mP24_6170 [Euryarchaeota archaeon]
MDPNDFISCHGEAKYCLRTYDDFTFAETHNAYSTIEDQILVGVNHYTGLQSSGMMASGPSWWTPITATTTTLPKRMSGSATVLASSSTPATSERLMHSNG